jgi:nitric oxide reductase large subunit
MKALKLFLIVIIALLLIVGVYSKIANTDFGYWWGEEGRGVTSIVITGNEILSMALILMVPLVVILKKSKR